MNEYRVHIENGMRIRHDAQARFTVKAGRKVLEDDLTPIETIGGAMIRAGIVYNRRSMSGGVDWWNPATGESVPKPKVQIRVRPEDVLTGDELCGCDRCR